MSARTEVENYIHNNWVDTRVADWVIRSFPLLEHGYTYTECPVFSISIQHGLEELNPIPFPGDFQRTPKIVISGGFEGTEGHLAAVRDMDEIRVVTGKLYSPIVLMLEQDSYIVQRKKRQPMVNLDQRIRLWSTSGLVDAIIVLPEQEPAANMTQHFSRINDLIQPAVWCANIENPYWREIITRGSTDDILDVARITDFESYLHTSFLANTKGMDVKVLKKQLYAYIRDLVEKTETQEKLRLLRTDDLAKIIFEEKTKNL